MNRKLVIWGAGQRGKRLIPIFREYVDAFIDIDPAKQGQSIDGIYVISYETYERIYSKDYIVISPIHEKEVIEFLTKNHNPRYFCMSDLPGEFQESCPKPYLADYLREILNADREYVIQGYDLYAYWLNELHSNIRGYYTDMIPHIGISKERLLMLKQDFDEYPYEDISDTNPTVLVTHEEDIESIQNSHRVINVYDCSDSIKEYYNPEREKLRDLYLNKRCFIVATGPSLRMKDLDALHEMNEICISMNMIFYAFPNTSWRPQFYIVDDFRLIHDDGLKTELNEIPHVILGDVGDEYLTLSLKDNITWHHYQYEHSENRFPKFSSDFSRKSYGGCTVTYSCIQLAAYLGFKEI